MDTATTKPGTVVEFVVFERNRPIRYEGKIVRNELNGFVVVAVTVDTHLGQAHGRPRREHTPRNHVVPASMLKAVAV